MSVIKASLRRRSDLEAGRLPAGPCPPGLGEDDVHLWYASLDLPTSTVETLRKILSLDELERAGRQRAVKDQDRFVAARGQLRIILASYLSVPLCRLRFTYGGYGKPMLTRESEGDLRFNLTHAGASVLYVIARGREVGVDLERICSHPIDEQLANQYFSSCKNAALQELSVPARPEAFFRYWTRREAYGKVRGDGLRFLRKRFDVLPVAGESVAAVETEAHPHHSGRWFLRDLEQESGYVAARVVEGRGWQLTCGRFAVSVIHAPGDRAASTTSQSWFASRPN
jgi:4'-phosphopantetheinyl transferase